MPCNRRYFIGVDLMVSDREILSKAIVDAGGRVIETDKLGALTFEIPGHYGPLSLTKDGKLHGNYYTWEKPADIANTLKRAYTAQVIKTAGQRFGWQVQASPDKRQLTLGKRGL